MDQRARFRFGGECHLVHHRLHDRHPPDTLEALIPLLERQTDRAWRQEIEANIDKWWRILEDRAMMDADPMNPQRVAHELSSRLPDRCILTADSGSATTWWAPP